MCESIGGEVKPVSHEAGKGFTVQENNEFAVGLTTDLESGCRLCEAGRTDNLTAPEDLAEPISALQHNS